MKTQSSPAMYLLLALLFATMMSLGCSQSQTIPAKQVVTPTPAVPDANFHKSTLPTPTPMTSTR